jgi:hypothetical protein
MPRACPVEGHGGFYVSGSYSFWDATGLPRGASSSSLLRSFSLAAVGVAANVNLHGASPWHRYGRRRHRRNQRNRTTGQARGIHRNLPRASPWHSPQPAADAAQSTPRKQPGLSARDRIAAAEEVAGLQHLDLYPRPGRPPAPKGMPADGRDTAHGRVLQKENRLVSLPGVPGAAPGLTREMADSHRRWPPRANFSPAAKPGGGPCRLAAAGFFPTGAVAAWLPVGRFGHYPSGGTGAGLAAAGPRRVFVVG